MVILIEQIPFENVSTKHQPFYSNLIMLSQQWFAISNRIQIKFSTNTCTSTMVLLSNMLQKLRVILMPTLLSLVTPAVVIMTTAGVTSDNKVSITMTYFSIWSLRSHEIWRHTMFSAHWGQNNMANIWWAKFWNAISWMKICVFD